ncbi:MAG: group III truncated hemoglobin [Rhodanobacter sp.]|jgi:hemoglobin|nr:group III truncated hemoglobin [Rhodanobacter sp.]
MRDSLLDEPSIALVVDRFYDKVRIDPTLGPIFADAVDDWDAHKRVLVSFWSSVALGAGSYRGQPMDAHRPHPIRAEHFGYWLELWQATCNEVLEESAALQLVATAQRIGRSLQHGLGIQPRASALGIPIMGITL